MAMFARSHGHKGRKSATRLCERTSGVIDAIDLERCESAPKRASSASDSVNTCSNGRCDTAYTKGVWDVRPNSTALMANSLISRHYDVPGSMYGQPEIEAFFAHIMMSQC